jgi:uncharacterized OB-fold protein
MSELISDEDLVSMFGHLGIDRDSAPHYRGRIEHRLLISRCSDCGTYQQPPRPICPRCWSMSMVPTEVSGAGVIDLVIFLHQGPPAAEVDYSTPYPVASVGLDEQPGLRFTATVIGSPNEEIAIGRRVVLDWIDRAGVPTPAFRLAGGPA